METAWHAIDQTRRGIWAALRSRAGVVIAVAAAVAAFDLIVPVVVLSLARRPADFFTFNPWLRRLPDYVASAEPFGAKLAYLSHLTLAWVSAEGGDGIDWGFILDVPALAQIACTSILFGIYFSIWSYARGLDGCAVEARPAGMLGAVTTVFGLTSAPCTLAGCGAPVLPVLGLAFTGLPGGTLSTFAAVARIAVAAVLTLMAFATVWLGWRAGAAEARLARLR